MSNNWYDSEQNGWYAPLRQESAPPAAPAPKKRVWPKALAAVAALIALIVGTALLFPNREAQSAEGEKNGGFSQFILPPKDDEKGPEDYDDYREFFENFYTPAENSRAQYHIERAALPIDFRCELAEPEEELTLQELYRRSVQSIVAITGYIDGKSGYVWGTGVILSEDGLVLTNAHVLEDCDRATVTLYDDTVCEARLVGADSISDIAVLKIEAEGLTPAVFGDSALLEVGDPVAAIGNPLREEFRLTLTNGIISGIERGLNYKGHSMNLLQTNTAINEGNSGGPLYNMYGQVVGITNMKMVSSYSNIEGIGFAIPSANVAKLVNTLVRDGAVTGRASIGITVGAIPDEARERFGDKLPESGGLYIVDVAEGSDAAAKGVRPGDILCRVNGAVLSETSELSAMKDALSVGDTMRFTILRDGEILEIDVMLVDTNDVYG